MNKFMCFRTLVLMASFLAIGVLAHASGSGMHGVSQEALSTALQEKGNPLGIEVEPVSLSRGVRIKSVQENSLGARIGLQAGDIITTLNQEMVYNIEKFDEVAAAIPEGKDIEIRVQRGAEQVKARFQLKQPE